MKTKEISISLVTKMLESSGATVYVRMAKKTSECQDFSKILVVLGLEKNSCSCFPATVFTLQPNRL